MKLEEQLTYQTPGVPSILSILPNRPVSQGLNRERSSFFLSATSLRSSRLRRSRSLLTRALDLPGWSETKRKWNYIFRLKAIFQPDRSFLFRFDPNFDNFSAENENFLKWNGKFRSDDRTDGGPPLEVVRWTALREKFPREPKRSISFSTEIFEIFGIMESTLCSHGFHSLFRQRATSFLGSLT